MRAFCAVSELHERFRAVSIGLRVFACSFVTSLYLYFALNLKKA